MKNIKKNFLEFRKKNIFFNFKNYEKIPKKLWKFWKQFLEIWK